MPQDCGRNNGVGIINGGMWRGFPVLPSVLIMTVFLPKET